MFALFSRKWEARRAYLWLTAAQSVAFALIFTVDMVYQVQVVGLTPLQLVLVGTTLEVTIFLFEVPTGVVADVYSRRLSILIGLALIGLGFILQGSIPTFAAVLTAQLLWGIGYTFTSGATQAWITDEVGETQVGPIFLRGSQIDNLVGIAASVIAIVIGNVLLNLPILLGGALFVVLAAGLVLVMPEQHFHATPTSERSSWRQMSDTLRAGLRLVRGRRILLAILGIGLFYGLYSEGLDRLNTKHLLESFTLPEMGGLQPVVWIGAIGLIGQFLSAGVLRLAEKRLDMTTGRPLARALLGVNVVLVGGLVGFALAGSFVMAVLFRWLITVSRTLIEPVYATWINQHIDSSVRATIISMSSQVDAFGQMVGGPPVGVFGERFGIRAALAASAAILSPVVALTAVILRRGTQP
jgi:DHA3 family tetracycline resistance protein-like MFS transporter